MLFQYNKTLLFRSGKSANS